MVGRSAKKYYLMYMEELSTMTKKEMLAKVEFLKEQLSGDMFEDMDIKDEIHNLQMKIDGNKPMDTRIDCIGCGS
jgi:hypothetical protein|tara:strand:+ start:7342 stop:7566 length:225 start_codon:yes stop_codon:yes gene_type:complete